MKLCPLKFGEGVKIEGETYYKCEEEKCAWYDTKYNDCAMLLLGVGMFNK